MPNLVSVLGKRLRIPYRLWGIVKRNRTTTRASLPTNVILARRGFTLVELIIVASIVAGVFSTGIYVNTTGSINKAKDAQRAQDIEQIKNAVDLYYHDNNCYPATTNSAFSDALSAGSSWQEGSTVYMTKIPKDPDGTAYTYKTDTGTCPQWMIVYADLSRTQTSHASCRLPGYVTSVGSTCIPVGYDASFGCVSSGNVTCNMPTPTVTPTGIVVSPTPTTVPGGGAPIVTTVAASSITKTTATLNSTINANSHPTNYWWQYGTSNAACSSLPQFTITRTIQSGSTSPTFGLTGLTGTTTYYFCAVAQNSSGTTYGSVLSFTTPDLPIVTTVAASPVTLTGATLNATINANGASTTYWWRYGTSNVACSSLSSVTSSGNLASGTSSPTSALTGLSTGTVYYFCAVAQNLVGTTYGTVLTFTPSAAPSVTTVAASSVVATGATLNATINTNGASTTYWWRYGTSNVACDSLSQVTTTSVLSSGSSSVNRAITGLSGSTTYYFCAYGQNARGTTIGSKLSFTTPVACTNGYKNYDTDAYGGGTSACWPAGSYTVVATGGDCFDSNANARPGQTSYFTGKRGTSNDPHGNTYNSYDYNCNGTDDKQSGFTTCQQVSTQSRAEDTEVGCSNTGGNAARNQAAPACGATSSSGSGNYPGYPGTWIGYSSLNCSGTSYNWTGYPYGSCTNGAAQPCR